MDVELNLKAENYARDLAISISSAEQGANRLESANKRLGDSYSASAEQAQKYIDKQRKLNSNSKDLAAGMAKIAAAGMAVGKSVSYFQNMTRELDGIGKSSRNLDITAEQLQGLRYAAKSANFDAGKLESVFARMQNVIGGAMAGDSAAVKNLQNIGLEIEDLKSKNPYEIFENIAQALTSINDPAERTREGIAIFGKEFVKMNEFLRTYASRVETAKASGMIISNEAVAAAERYQQVLTDIDTSIKALIANSSALKNLSGWLAEIQALSSNGAAAKGAGLVTRKQAVDESIDKAEKSGKYTPEQIQKMRAVSNSYANQSSEFWIGRRYKGAYSDLDKAVTEAGYKDAARQNGKFSGVDYVTRRKSPEEVQSELAAARKKRDEQYSAEFDRNMRRNMTEASGESKVETSKPEVDPEQAQVDKENARIESELKAMKEEEQVLDLILAGKQKEAALQKEINDLRRDGVLSERNAEKIARQKMEIEEKRKKISANEYLKKQAESVAPKNDKRAQEIERMTKEMEKILGDKVPREMRKQIEQIADLKVKMEEPEQKLKIPEKPASINRLVDAGGMRLNREPVNIREYNKALEAREAKRKEIEAAAQKLKNQKPQEDVIEWGPEPKPRKIKDQTGEPEKVSIPQVADQTYTIRGNVDAPNIPVPEDQTYNVTANVEAPNIPDIPEQTVEIHFRDTAGFIDKLRTMQANLDAASASAIQTSGNAVQPVAQSSLTSLKQSIERVLGKEIDILSTLRTVADAFTA